MSVLDECLCESDLSTEISSEISLTSSDVNEDLPKIRKCRFAERMDLRKIGNLVKCRTLNLFPDSENLVSLYENSCLPLVQENEQLDEIVSAMFLCNYPNVPAVSQSAWPSWMDRLYDVKEASSANTLFVHLVVWDEEAKYKKHLLLVDLLTTTFYAVARCDYVVLVLPPCIEPADAICKVMTRVAPKSESIEVEAQVLYVGERRRFVPQMRFRLVVEEDNDDVIQLLDNDTTLLREFYGDFYSSELSRHPDPWRQLVIADSEDQVAAVACLNEKIDLELLNDRFELSAFDGFKRRSVKFAPSLDDSDEEYEEDYPFRMYNGDNESKEIINTNDAGIEFPNVYLDNNSDYEEHKTIPKARGDAFALELLGFRWDDEPMRLQASSRELLAAAFECFPKLRYCLALMPTDRKHFPFLDHFTRIPLKPDKDFPMALYAVHRASIRHRALRVREAQHKDHEAISRLLDHSQNILADFNEALKDDSSLRSYVFTCDDIIAGLAIVCTEEKKEVNRLVVHYRVEDLLNCKQEGILSLLKLKLAPIFQTSTGFFLTEIMRLEAVNTIFYRWLGEIEDAPSCLSTMQAVEPRVRNWPQFQRLFEREHEEKLPFEELFSLYVTSTRLVTMSKQIVNVKIVVVGASNCGLAFVDSLASGYKYRDLEFTNVTLISTNGMPYENSDYTVRRMIPYRGRYCHSYGKVTSSRMNYNVVKGTVVGIDRKKQQVYVEDSGELTYDYLVLACGTLFQLPEFAQDPDHADNCTLEPPSNYFTINDDIEASRCLKEIKKLTKNFEIQKSIVFYGNNVECYCALATFLELGLEGSWITLIEPKLHARNDEYIINDRQIRDHLHAIISEFGVKLLTGYNLVDWKLDSTSSRRIENVVLLLPENNNNNNDDDDVVGPSSTMLVTCDALLGFHAKSPCLKTFLAISRAGLVFDGRLVIDSEFRTNDRRVFAAGTMTKYSRRLRAADREHKYFNSLQVGEKLAEKFVNVIMSDKDVPTRDEKPVELPEFLAPIIISCILPGGYRYLHVRKPGPRRDDDDNQATGQDDVLTTGSCTADTGYFRLRLNQFHALECVTCFGKTDYDIQNVIALYGKHEALFDDLKTRFSNSEIPDFYEYFREPWASALFADDFDDFCLRRKCSYEVEPIGENLFREVLNALKKSNGMRMTVGEDIVDLMSIEADFNAYEEEVKQRLIEYLERHENELPMYSTPEKRRQILNEIADKPLLLDDLCDSICQSSPTTTTTNTSTSRSNDDDDDATHVLESCYCSCGSNSSSEIVLT